MECILCKLQYVGKPEIAFNLRLNNHRKDTNKHNSILAYKHFQEKGHNFNQNAKEALQEMLVIRETFWIQELKTLVPFGLNQELSK